MGSRPASVCPFSDIGDAFDSRPPGMIYPDATPTCRSLLLDIKRRLRVNVKKSKWLRGANPRPIVTPTPLRPVGPVGPSFIN